MLITDILRTVDEQNGKIPVKAESLAAVAQMQGTQKINSSTAKKLVKELIESDFDPVKYVEDNDLEQINDRELLSKLIDKAISENPKSVEDYKAGKQSALKAIIGKVMAQTGGKGNPVVINELMDEFASKL